MTTTTHPARKPRLCSCGQPATRRVGVYECCADCEPRTRANVRAERDGVDITRRGRG